MTHRNSFSVASALASSFALLLACSAGSGTDGGIDGGADGGGPDGGLGSGTDGGLGTGTITPGGVGPGGGQIVAEPKTCADAAASESYVGCDFWPTITANPVWEEFEFAVVLANGSDDPSEVTVVGPANFSVTRTVAPGALETIYLPWVPELKGPEYSLTNTSTGRLTTSLSLKAGAYHLTSTFPVSAWQFNPLHFRKDRDDCGPRILANMSAAATECRAASNDASLLLPSTAMTGNYRVGVYSGARGDDNWGSVPGGIAITATANGTTVDVQLPPDCDAVHDGQSYGCVVAGGEAPAAVQGDVLTFQMDAGDVIELLGAYGKWAQTGHADLSGTLINASQNIQVIAFNAIVNIPDETSNADHAEETVLPAEVIGNQYVVPVPTAFGGAPSGHVVRIYGNVDGTVLNYPDGKPPGAPDTINAGEMVELPPRAVNNQCGSGASPCYLTEPFVVNGDQPFAVASFQLGGKLQVAGWPVDNAEPGDPAMSMMVTPKQFRTSYTFLAPADFMENYADILVPDGAEVLLDGAAPVEPATPIGTSGWSIIRAKLSSAGGGIHTLSTNHESGLGLQVSGFGNATSYYYPGGLNLKKISEAPTIVK